MKGDARLGRRRPHRRILLTDIVDTFELPQRKPTVSKPRSKVMPKEQPPKYRGKPNQPQVEVNRQERVEQERAKNQAQERKEYLRFLAQAERRKAKALGLCRHCRNTAIPLGPGSPRAPIDTGCPAGGGRHSGGSSEMGNNTWGEAT